MFKRTRVMPTCAVLIICIGGGAPPAADADVRAYPDPGHARLGIYAGPAGDDFDYAHRKLTVTDPFPNKAAWWASLKAAAPSGGAEPRHEIYLVYCGEREGDAEAAQRRLDAWLRPEADVPTYPDLIPAIALGEENITQNRETLDRLARHVRGTYGIPVFQWYSDPLAPDPNLTADGWIWDSYGMKPTAFRKHVMKFTALRKPAVCVVWAADPHWPGWNLHAGTAALMDAHWHQFDTCREFNVPCVAFAVAGPSGSVAHWRSSPTPDMVRLRAALALRREAMHRLPAGYLPPASADFSAADRTVPIGGPPDAPGVYEETFDGFQWLHDADIRGFTHLKLASRPESPPGQLDLVTEAGVPVGASLTYRFDSYYPIDWARVSFAAAAPAATHAANRLQVSPDGREWHDLLVQQGTEAVETRVSDLPAWFRGRTAFLLRLELTNHAERAGLCGNRLDTLRVEAAWQPPPDGASAPLAADLYGALRYADGFDTVRWGHLGTLAVSHPDRGGYRNGAFWVGGVKDYAVTARLVQRLVSPRPLAALTVIADGSADGPNLGGRLTLRVARAGAEPTWSTQSTGDHRGELRLTVPSVELDGLSAFDVHVELRGNSGVDLGSTAAAVLDALRIEAK